jgi:putative lipoic acid-binding regulatory protein
VSDRNSKQPEISYPCRWEYKVIGRDDRAVEAAVSACVQDLAEGPEGARDFDLSFSRASGKGNYLSFKLELEVSSQAERDRLFRALSTHPAISMVI